MATPTDPNYSLQGQFDLIGDIESIWDDYNGAGVHVAVFDDGVQSDHPDLAANYDDTIVFSYDGVVYDSEPNGTGNGHGTACAGIIGAVGNNGVGGAGVAWGVTLTGVDYLVDIQNAIFSSGFDSGLLLAAMSHTQNFDIVSNSWGSDPIYAGYQNASSFGSSSYYTVTGFKVAIENGRDGLGTIINQAAGNEDMNLNGAGVNNTRYTVSVAATDLNGNVEDYSNFGTSLLISAPAINYTTDRTGSDGYTNGDYMSGFNGTSAATPVISGVTALMLEAESVLGWRDVQNILAISAQQTGSAYGGAGTGEEVGEWMSNDAGNWNGGGMSYHLSYGFGMVDAFAAVRMAEAWLTIFDEAQTSANEVSMTHDGGSVTIPSNQIGAWSTMIVVPPADSIEIEDITVTLSLAHTYADDLTITLVGPDGSEYEIFTDQFFSNNGALDPALDIDFTWDFGITGALGMLSEGTWTLRIEDSFDLDGGTLSDWDIEFFGTEVNSDDVYHYTNDFLTLQAADGDRDNLVDDGLGEDWINMSAVTERAVVVMGGANGRIEVDGVTWTNIDANSDIENIYMGDGNDRVIGNALNNEIHGGRGADRLEGRKGDDILVGGAGADELDGGDGLDSAGYQTSGRRIKVDFNDDSKNRGDAAADTYISIEGVIGTDYNDNIAGNSGINILVGGGGDDKLYGRGGDDILAGGEGADLIHGSSGTDIASYIDASSGVEVDLTDLGASTGDAAGDTYISIEGLMGSDFADKLRGDANDNVLIGQAGNDVMHGRDGDDTLFGGEGRDVIIGGDGKDTMSGGDDNDRDIFRFYNTDESQIGGANRDVITDFDRTKDVIDVSNVDAVVGVSGDQDFFYIGDGSFSGTAGELRYLHQNGRTLIQMDVDGDGVRDMEIELTGTINLSDNDFIL